MNTKEPQATWFIQWKDYAANLKAVKVSLPKSLGPVEAAAELIPDLADGPGLGEGSPQFGQYWLLNSETGEEIPIQVGQVVVRKDLDLAALRERARSTKRLIRN